MRVFLTGLVLFSMSSTAPAQPGTKTPEQLLPADCLIYYHYDGYEPHRKAYDQTALAMAMKEGLSAFFDHLFAQIFTLPTVGLGRDNGKKRVAPGAEADGFLDCIGKHGIAVSVEIAPPRPGPANAEELYQVTIVFPHGAEKKNRDALETVFRLAAGALEAQVEDAEYQGRTIRIVSQGAHKAAWWPEGKHLVLALGQQPIERAVRVIDGQRPNVTKTPWFPELAKFNRYETDMRGYVNVEAAVDRLAGHGLDAPGFGNLKDHVARQLLLRHLGLTGLNNLTFHLGFDGKYQRSTIRLGVAEPGRRAGLLNLVSGSFAFAPDKLPPLPPDTDYVSARHVDWGQVFDYVRTTYGMLAISQLFNGEFPDRFPDLDRVVGGDFRKDFLDQLDTTLVSYGGHSEGPFFLGQAFAVKVKDAAKVRKGLEGIAKELGAIDETMTPEKRTFRGVDTHVFSGALLPITYTVHNDWLVFGLFPQAVQGFILRSGGKYRAWKAPPELDEVLAKERKANPRGKVLAASVSDPRPVIQLGLSLIPMQFHFANLGGVKILDVTKIPNTQAVNEWLFPNIRVCYDDGNALRWENHYSINEPDDLLLAMFVPSAVALLDSIPFSLPARRPRAAKVIEGEAADPNRPVMCPATAVEQDGAVTIQITVPREIAYEEVRKVRKIAEKEEIAAGVKRKVYSTDWVEEKATGIKVVPTSRMLTADGKTVRVSRKDGTAVDPKELPKLLEKETRVLLVTKGNIDAETRQNLDDRTLIVTVGPSGPEAIHAPRKVP